MPHIAPKAPPKPHINPAEMIAIDDHADAVACDGGGGALGHPLVYYSFDGADRVECLYCDRIFVKKQTIGQ